MIGLWVTEFKNGKIDEWMNEWRTKGKKKNEEKWEKRKSGRNWRTFYSFPKREIPGRDVVIYEIKIRPGQKYKSTKTFSVNLQPFFVTVSHLYGRNSQQFAQVWNIITSVPNLILALNAMSKLSNSALPNNYLLECCYTYRSVRIWGGRSHGIWPEVIILEEQLLLSCTHACLHSNELLELCKPLLKGSTVNNSVRNTPKISSMEVTENMISRHLLDVEGQIVCLKN